MAWTCDMNGSPVHTSTGVARLLGCGLNQDRGQRWPCWYGCV